MVQKCFKSKNFFDSKKVLNSKKIFEPKNFGSKNNYVKKICVQKILGSKNIWKKFWVTKIFEKKFGSKKILGLCVQESFWVQKTFLVPKKFLNPKKILGPKNFRSKNLGSKNIWKRFWVQKNCGSQKCLKKFLGPNKFWVFVLKKVFGSKKSFCFQKSF